NGNKVQSLDGETKKVMPVVAAQGTQVAYISKGAKSVVVLNTTDGSSEEYPYNFAEQSTSSLAFAPDGAVYLCDSTGIYRHASGGTLWERIVDGTTTSIGLPAFYVNGLYIANDGSNDIYVTGGNQLLKYALDENASATAAKTLTVFSLHEENIVQQAVVAFNRMQSEVSVEYTVAMNQSTGGTEQDYIKALNTELLAGKGPDIIILDGLPMDSYIEKGVLSDIGEIVDGAESALPNVRNSFVSADGKLYAMPTRIKLPLAVAGKDSIGAFASLSALADRCGQSGEIPYLANAAFSEQTLAEVLLSYYGTRVESGNEQDITSFLSDAGRIAKAIGSTDQLCVGWEALSGTPQSELLDGMRVSNYGPQLWAYMTGRAQGMLLLPLGSIYSGMIVLSAAEQTESMMTDVAGQYQPAGIVGINRASAVQDAAADFVKVLLSYDVQTGDRFADTFPVNTKALSDVMNVVDNSISQSMRLDSTNSLESEWPAQATRETLLKLLQSVDQPLSTDHTLNDMLTPPLVAYLNGSDTLESAVGKTKSILATYLSE
ncbi:MAG: extracellular solute-binding protein, partial [Eubacteriales bacterium]|nr:extracellular solute-binding protein [Eubacteriales bacterium]